MTTTMRARIKAIGGAVLLIAFMLTWAAFPAFATNKKDGDVEAKAYSEATADAAASAESISEGGAGYGGQGGNSAAVNEGIEVDASDKSSVENNSSNIVLVPNNNTENCLRVWGLGWGNSSGSGGIGVPVRSKKCDIEAAADDAFAGGEREIGWWWKCQNSNLYDSFMVREKGVSREVENDRAIDACHKRMLNDLTLMKVVHTLEERLELVERERNTARKLHKESVERITEACTESKNRILATCAGK